MIVNASNLAAVLTGFQTAFRRGFDGAESSYKRFAMVVPSSAGSEVYGWLGMFPKMREWIGQRVVNSLAVHTFAIENKKFEQTISVPRTAIEDDTIGIYQPMFEEMGRNAAELPDELIYSLLALGFSTNCYDGQYFFDTDHPVIGEDGLETSVSNTASGGGDAWFLLDTSRAVKPMIFQERMPANRLTKLDSDNDQNVFFNDEYIYGTRGRSNVGFGLWQLAFGSTQTLNADNYAAARHALMSMKGDHGRILGIRPNLLVVPPSLESAGLKILNSELGTGGETNEWKGTADLLVTPWLA